MSRVQLPKAAQKSPAGTNTLGDDEEDDEDSPTSLTRPGGLQTSFVKLPNMTPQMKPRTTLGPHLHPDAEFDLGDRASIGILGIADGLRPSTISSALGRGFPGTYGAKAPASPNSRPRDIGIGATFEIKLGP